MNNEAIKKTEKPTSIRLEENLLEKIKKDAKNQKRSISGQISYIIEKYYSIKND